MLKVTGQNSYIHGFSELKQFSHVVKSLLKQQDIELVLVRKTDPAVDKPRDIEDVSFYRLSIEGPVNVNLDLLHL